MPLPASTQAWAARFAVDLSLFHSQETCAMTQPLPAHRQCSGDIVGGLIETASAALLESFPVLSGDPYDVELVIDALRVLRPKLGEMETLGGLLHMVRGNWDDAIHVFSQVVATAPSYAYGKALLAFALASKGDPDWRQAAAEALSENPDTETRKLIATLQARDDLREAVRRHENGAEFVVPESVAALNAGLDEAASPPDSPGAGTDAPTAVPQANYLRI
jgi:type III secretion protein HrpB1